MGRSQLYHVGLVFLGICLLSWCFSNWRQTRLRIDCGNDQFEREYGRTNLRLSRGYEGSLYRLERFMGKLQRGEKVTVSVVGGSVTRGHQVWTDEIWFSRLVQWLESMSAEVISVNGATPATGSDYYSYCFPLHIPPESDLVLIELGINDSAWEGHVVDMENLMRGLLGMDQEPAVILVEALAFANGGVGGGGGRMHLPVAQFYDVPVINQRLPLVGHFARYPELIRTYFSQNFWGYPDTWHLNSRGHRDLGMLVASLLQDVVCSLPPPSADIPPEASRPWRVDETSPALPGRFMNSSFPVPIPRQGVLEGWNPDTLFSRQPWKPWCNSEQSPDNSTALKPLRTSGWTHWIDPSGQTKPYFTANEPGARVTFEVEVQSGGSLELYSMRSRGYGLGTIKCWVGEDEDGARKVVGWWDDDASIGRLAIIAEGVQPGLHEVTCEILEETSDPGGGHEFRMIAIMSS